MPGIETIIIWLVIGAIAGWLAGMIVAGYGFGLIGNIVVGIVGAIIGGWLLPRLGIGSIVSNAIIDAIVFATVGAVIFLFIIGLLRF
jgi:uncharacterized membrane protein YeaQ/YmgE (transglycosylase-associated protein family)